MRKMIIMRGPPGVGKSTLCKTLGLEQHKLSTDDLRLSIGAPELNADGAWAISQKRGEDVWALFKRLTRERVGRGETLVLDAMFLLAADVREYVDLAKSLGYEVALADFTAFPIERAIAQDQNRDKIRQVGRSVIETLSGRFAQNSVGVSELPGLSVFSWKESDDGASMVQGLKSWLVKPVLDLSAYERVIHIGDVQGCFTVLAGHGAPLEHGFDPKAFYVFCGDLVDRGLENGKVVKWFHDVALPCPNVALLWGNHEDHLWRFGEGLASVSREFMLRTQPDLIKEGVTADMAKKVVASAVDVLPYMWRGCKVVVNHAGLTGLPPLDEQGAPLWHLLSREQLSRGAGNYNDPIDEIFTAKQLELSTELRWTQVHGHRNGGVTALQSLHSVNLEDRVEFGGNLRMATLDSSGWSAVDIHNKVFASWRVRFAKPKTKEMGVEEGEIEEDGRIAFDVRAPIPSWSTNENSAPPKLTQATIDAMRAHEGVQEKAMPDRPHISSLNFTRHVFFDKAWDEVVVKARGLFYDTSTHEIASRGYEKFFNIGERPDTELSALAKTLQFPVVGYLKENGFLGNLGYDAVRGEIMCASKSTTGGDFAAWFKEIFESLTTPTQREEIKRYLRDAEACMVFEVVDPVRDPHMIDYPAAKLTLLDIFHRSEDGLKLPYADLKKAADVFGLQAKRRMFEFPDMKSMTGWISHAYHDLGYRYDNQDIEGVVFEDKAGFQTKCKLPHYGFWKSMRSSKERIARIAERRELLESEIARNPSARAARAQELSKLADNLRLTLNADEHPMAKSFLAWCSGKSSQDLSSQGVIELRKAFDKEVGIDPAWIKVKWDRFDPTEKEESKPKTILHKTVAAEPDVAPPASRGPKV